MESLFFKQQGTEEQTEYIELLQVVGGLSNLFSDQPQPYLYYRAMENIFCKSFKADNLSRGDISADAGFNGLGIGLKTFLQNNGNTFQKVAEFNKDSVALRELKDKALVIAVANMRNARIRTTQSICSLSDMMYHLVTRNNNYMAIFEEKMDLITLDNIRVTKSSKNTIHFTDGLHEYTFSLSKSTLLKRFDTSENKKIIGFDVEILDDPYSFLLSRSELKGSREKAVGMLKKITQTHAMDYIVLPLYSPRTGRVEEKSGLNQWNAEGRARDENEVYIPIPLWIHQVKKGFFDYNTADNRTAAFEVTLPNQKKLSMKVAQQGGKALMSNPNSELGEWILREILQLKPSCLVTKEQLDIIGIDSVKLSKVSQGKYLLDFLQTGSFEKFTNMYSPV